MTDLRVLAQERSKVIGDEPVSLDLRRLSLRAASALHSMSDRNFDKAPQSHKTFCKTALRECEEAWADHLRPQKG